MLKQQKNMLIWACVLIASSVILGAFGAHGLKGKISPEKIISFDTGVKYQMYHGLALLCLAILVEKFEFSLKFVKIGILLGVLLFSGSIYILSLQELVNMNLSKIVGPITPLGGLLFVISWLVLAIQIFKMKSKNA
jgi:uncharacterized membrane protein YgdD (TMEM256/DUF423 family)